MRNKKNQQLLGWFRTSSYIFVIFAFFAALVYFYKFSSWKFFKKPQELVASEVTNVPVAQVAEEVPLPIQNPPIVQHVVVEEYDCKKELKEMREMIESSAERTRFLEEKLHEYSVYVSALVLIDVINQKISNNEPVAESIAKLGRIILPYSNGDFVFLNNVDVVSNIELVRLYTSSINRSVSDQSDFASMVKNVPELNNSESVEQNEDIKEVVRGGFVGKLITAKDYFLKGLKKLFPEGSFVVKDRPVDDDESKRIIVAILDSRYVFVIALLEEKMRNGKSVDEFFYKEIKKKQDLRNGLHDVRVYILQKLANWF